MGLFKKFNRDFKDLSNPKTNVKSSISLNENLTSNNLNQQNLKNLPNDIERIKNKTNNDVFNSIHNLEKRIILIEKWINYFNDLVKLKLED